MCLEISQITVEEYGRLIYVNTNEPRHQMMCTRRALVDLGGGGGHVRRARPNGAKTRDRRLTYKYIVIDNSASLQLNIS